METILSIDSITIQVINTAQYQKLFNQFYLDKNYVVEKTKSNNPDVKNYRVFHVMNPRITLFYITHSGTRHNQQTYTTFKFVGLKSHHSRKDKKRNLTLKIFIEFISKLDIKYRITKLDVAFDFFAENKTIENFLPIIKGTSTSINNPFNTFKTTLYTGNINVIKPSVTAYIYDKSIKENLIDKIFRFEISIRNFNKIKNNFEVVVKHTQKVLSQYRLFYFENKANCNKIKREYRDNIPKKNKENFSKSLEKKTFKLSAQEFNLSLSDEIIDFIKSVFTKTDELITHERKLPSWLKKRPAKKLKVKKITTLKSEMIDINYGSKIDVLQLSNDFLYTYEIPILIKGFYPTNKAPP